MQCNLWDVHLGPMSTTTDNKPRAATYKEVEAYMVWQRQRKGLPEKSEIKLHWAQYASGAKGGAVCVGATFGRELKAAHFDATKQVYIAAAYEVGAYSLVMPGHDAHREKVTMETLNDAGEVIASSTMPREPKKGGVIWSTADVRNAHGKIRKGQPLIVPDHVEALPEICAAAPVEAQEVPAPCHVGPEALEALHGPENGQHHNLDPLADVLARLSCLESRLEALAAANDDQAPAMVEPVAAVEPEAAARDDGRQRAARLRLIRRYLAIRQQRAALADEVAGLDAAMQRQKDKRRASVARAMTLQRQRDQARLQAASAMARIEKQEGQIWQEWDYRRRNAERARRMVSAARAECREAQQSASASRTELAALRASLADPRQPERASDIARLVQERDTARTALAAVEQRNTAMQAALNQSAEIIESFGLRLAKAEAMVRRMAA